MLPGSMVETDVLVIGGGMAGCFAAIKAREQGVDVVLVDKGYVSRSGQTPFASGSAFYNPKWGHKLEDWMDQVNRCGEYINNREWDEIVFKDSYDRYRDLVAWGVEFAKANKEDAEPIREPHPYGAANDFFYHRNVSKVLRKQTLARGAKILDRIMITDLIKQDGKVVGAIGIPMDSYDIYIFKAKAVAICAGASTFKALGWNTYAVTGDGHTMAYRAGAEIMGKEFIDTHFTTSEHPGYKSSPRPFLPGDPFPSGIPDWKFFNAEGTEVPRVGITWPLGLELYFEAHAGRAPLIEDSFWEPQGGRIRRVVVGNAGGGLNSHCSDGIHFTNTQCASSVPGLYAAGDSLGTLWCGASYSGIGFATTFAAVTGTRAGTGAAEYALRVGKPTVKETDLADLKKIAHAPTERKGGFSPRWVTQVIQNTMVPYYVMCIKHGERMQAALTNIEFLRDHIVPKLTAKDPHELRLAHETRNMVLNAEMQLRASIYRTESRGSHYREDYPRRDDPAWLAWVILKEEKGKMNVFKEPIPKEWWPDLSIPYQERYPFRYPGE